MPTRRRIARPGDRRHWPTAQHSPTARQLADEAAAADTAAVSDHAKLADNASKLGGKSVAEFLTSDTIRWITPFTIGRGHEGDGEGGSVHPDGPLHSERNDRRRRRSGPGRHHHLDDAGEVRLRRRRPARQSRPGRRHRDPPVRQHGGGAKWYREVRGVLGRPRDGRRRHRLHQGLISVRRHERGRPAGQVQVRRVPLP